MKPVDFKGRTHMIADDQPEYMTLPAYCGYDSNYGSPFVFSCWKASIWERLKILLTGRVYIQTLTYGASLQPQNATTQNIALLED